MIDSGLKIGLFGIGLNVYWDQFDGLKTTLESYLDRLSAKFDAYPVTIVNAGLVDTVDKAFETGKLFRQQDVGIIFLYVGTYALSSTVLPVVQRANVPVIILNLSPEAAIDYETFNNLGDRTQMTGEWLKYCSACPVPEIANVFKRTGIKFHQVTGILDNDPESLTEIQEWIEAANVANVMRYNRMGCMGSYYSGMMDIYTDLTLQAKYFGGHFEHIEVDELTAVKEQVEQADIDKRVAEFNMLFDVQDDCSQEELIRAARTSVALDQIVAKYKLGSFAYYHKGTGSAGNEDTMSSVILGNSLLTAKNVPVAGEYEIKNAQAMKIMDSFGAGGSFTEYYAMDYTDDVVLMGHDGPGHIAIAEGKIKVKPLKVYHGKVGSGLSVEMAVKHGPVTCLSVVEDGKGWLMLLVAEGESVPGPILQIGNTNSRYRFAIGAREFVTDWNSHGPAHHCAVGVGHIASKLHKLAAIIGLDLVQVC
ncbi:arabinose isomerase [Mucilaginibacter myungsuensis]|uniref:Arabinose isomerase n=1 Tax=Mucilaginibacter myungsuensis TaxID=649104 RepID=A0A929KXU2_9SPHI|nr:arabinose isomerase [Mucilaginibacter myungsuensis]MBE9660884.1 arabinose isomerase [Mucilaginibacter myungsuensis]MDN3600931.1 arabinose isomerase [Mucilaginibacter myungsuensis]